MPTVAETAFRKTTEREMLEMVDADASGNMKSRMGSRINPPPKANQCSQCGNYKSQERQEDHV